MESSQLEIILAQFGITRSKINGKTEPVWTLYSGDTNLRQFEIYFDEQSATWNTVTAHERNGHQDDNCERFVASKTRLFERAPEIESPLLRNAWTEALPSHDHVKFLHATKWATTSIGPCQTWPYALRLHAHMLFSDIRPAVIFWGPQRIAMYNESLKPLIGRSHPELMGQKFEDCELPSWDQFKSAFAELEKHENGLILPGLEVPITKYDHVEETYWDASLVSLKDDHGGHGGIYISWTDTTRTILRDRRNLLIAELSQISLPNADHVWEHIREVLSHSQQDIPMAIVYSVVATSLPGKEQLQLRNAIGISPDRDLGPATSHLGNAASKSNFVSLFARAQDAAARFIILNDENTLTSIIEELSFFAQEKTIRHVAIICLGTGDVARGYLIIGLNPRRDLDPDHNQFVLDLSRQLNELMARNTSLEMVRDRERYLSQALTDSERRMSQIVQMAPVGIYELSANGTLAWANSHFFDIIGLPHDRRDPATFDWRDHILPEDQIKANTQMGRSLMEKVEISDTLRLGRHWKPPKAEDEIQGEDEPYWVMYSACPDVQEDGTVRSLMGCFTNISHLKWAEQLQARVAIAAKKEKQKQEEFIDVVSHEMRNPLSAITQCADSILDSALSVQPAQPRGVLHEIIKSNAELAESISFCAAHQKRIIDDVLALSKLDSGLLTITPIAFGIDGVVERTLQMFRGELSTSQIEMRTVYDSESIVKASTMILGDSARITQIIVNLLTNAIKFTRTEAIRIITLRYGVSSVPPEASAFGESFQWYPVAEDSSENLATAEPRRDVIIYPYFALTDTGKGIAQDAIGKVFLKFEQEERTHVTYGGSGLGLFICKELAELQGGRVGIASESGLGSTFAFHTEARLANSPTIHNSGASQPQIIARNMPRPGQRSPVGLKILLVEDNVLNQKVLARLLIKSGCIVYIANHGGEAIDFVLALLGQPSEYASPVLPNMPQKVDCILMDWEMPVCNGITATKRIRDIERQHGDYTNIIIGITANARDEQTALALQAGMNSVLTKPFRVPELLERVDSVLQDFADTPMQ